MADARLDTFIHILSSSVSAFLRHPRKVTNSFAAPGTYQPQLHDNFVAHDPLAVAHAIFASEAWVSTPREFKLETEGKYTRGMCVVE
jgi:inosine-uridine nucleoside N-ribohydrolase